ncbi:MAG TPA: hypothetical protein DEB43_03135 [Desulfovibrio sp.]|nr:hypothetical protein [Desulfovibrio sp.]
MFEKKKNLNEEEIILNEQIKNFELYKKYVEPIYSKIFEQVKQLIAFLFILNGTALITAITLQKPSFNDIIKIAQDNLYLLFLLILFLIIETSCIFKFLQKKAFVKNYVQSSFSILYNVIRMLLVVCSIQALNYIGITYYLENILKEWFIK